MPYCPPKQILWNKFQWLEYCPKKIILTIMEQIPQEKQIHKVLDLHALSLCPTIKRLNWLIGTATGLSFPSVNFLLSSTNLAAAWLWLWATERSKRHHQNQTKQSPSQSPNNLASLLRLFLYFPSLARLWIDPSTTKKRGREKFCSLHHSCCPMRLFCPGRLINPRTIQRDDAGDEVSHPSSPIKSCFSCSLLAPSHTTWAALDRPGLEQLLCEARRLPDSFLGSFHLSSSGTFTWYFFPSFFLPGGALFAGDQILMVIISWKGLDFYRRDSIWAVFLSASHVLAPTKLELGKEHHHHQFAREGSLPCIITTTILIRD